MHRRLLASSFALFASFHFFAVGCTAPDDDSGPGGTGASGSGAAPGSGGLAVDGNNGTGAGLNTDSGTDGNTDGGCGSNLEVLFRDFKGSNEVGGHVDFEISATRDDPNGAPFKGWNDIGCGMVEKTLGAGAKPTFYAGPADTNGGVTVPVGSGQQKRVVSGAGCWTEAKGDGWIPGPTDICNIGTCAIWDFAPPQELSGATQFNQWFTTDAAVNVEVPSSLELTESSPGVRVYDSNAFFPIDDQGFGNTPGQAHNYHFTTEIHVQFTYEAGQVFSFRGDDDLWIFVNNQLALDVGGRHQALSGTIDFDAQAAALGITPGTAYNMDIFHAERQSDQSNFRIETNIRCFTPVVR